MFGVWFDAKRSKPNHGSRGGRTSQESKRCRQTLLPLREKRTREKELLGKDHSPNRGRKESIRGIHRTKVCPIHSPGRRPWNGPFNKGTFPIPNLVRILIPIFIWFYLFIFSCCNFCPSIGPSSLYLPHHRPHALLFVLFALNCYLRAIYDALYDSRDLFISVFIWLRPRHVPYLSPCPYLAIPGCLFGVCLSTP